MANHDLPHDDAETRARWANFAWAKDNAKTVAVAEQAGAVATALGPLVVRVVGRREGVGEARQRPVNVVDNVGARVLVPGGRVDEAEALEAVVPPSR